VRCNLPTRIIVLKEVIHPDCFGTTPDIWRLWLQWGRYVHEDGNIEHGYRFIWRRPDGSLQAARGQARIPSLKDAETLIGLAREQGWGEEEGER